MTKEVPILSVSFATMTLPACIPKTMTGTTHGKARPRPGLLPALVIHLLGLSESSP